MMLLSTTVRDLMCQRLVDYFTDSEGPSVSLTVYGGDLPSTFDDLPTTDALVLFNLPKSGIFAGAGPRMSLFLYDEQNTVQSQALADGVASYAVVRCGPALLFASIGLTGSGEDVEVNSLNVTAGTGVTLRGAGVVFGPGTAPDDGGVLS